MAASATGLQLLTKVTVSMQGLLSAVPSVLCQGPSVKQQDIFQRFEIISVLYFKKFKI
jgi:hypothetical protein